MSLVIKLNIKYNRFIITKWRIEMEFIPWGIAVIAVLFSFKTIYDYRKICDSTILQLNYEIKKLEKEKEWPMNFLRNLLYGNEMEKLGYKHLNY